MKTQDLQSLFSANYSNLEITLKGKTLDLLWWVDPGWMPGAHQSCSITPLLSWTGERKYNKSLVGRDKDREITQQLLSRAKQT